MQNKKNGLFKQFRSRYVNSVDIDSMVWNQLILAAECEDLCTWCDGGNFQSVTAFGRMMIELTKKHVEEMFTISNGYEHDAQVSQSLCWLLYSDYSVGEVLTYIYSESC